MLLQKMMKAMSMKKSMKKKVFKMQKLAVWKVRGLTDAPYRAKGQNRQDCWRPEEIFPDEDQAREDRFR